MKMSELDRIARLARKMKYDLNNEELSNTDWEGLPSPEHYLVVKASEILMYELDNDEIEQVVADVIEEDNVIDSFGQEVVVNGEKKLLEFELIMTVSEVMKYLAGDKLMVISIRNNDVDIYDDETGELIMKYNE